MSSLAELQRMAQGYLKTAVSRFERGEGMLTGRPIKDTLREQFSSPTAGLDFVSPLGMVGMVNKYTPYFPDLTGYTRGVDKYAQEEALKLASMRKYGEARLLRKSEADALKAQREAANRLVEQQIKAKYLQDNAVDFPNWE